MAKKPPTTKSDFEKDRSYVSDYLTAVGVDFFAILLPGFMCVVLTFILVFCAIAIVSSFLELSIKGYPTDQLSILVDLLRQFNIVIISFVISLSYVIGFIFFRLDPKVPDIASIWFLSKKDSKSDDAKNDSMVRYIKVGEEIDFPRGATEFPYSHLREYLKERNLKKLATLVPWSGKDFEDNHDICEKLATIDTIQRDKKLSRDERKKMVMQIEQEIQVICDAVRARLKKNKSNSKIITMLNNIVKFRSKIFINSLKLKIESCSPRLASRISRNEAHVRLMASSWYACKYLLRISGLVILACLSITILIIINKGNIHWETDLTNYMWFVTILLIVLAVFFAKRFIERFLYYQRVREIHYVLQCAYICGLTHPHLKILK